MSQEGIGGEHGSERLLAELSEELRAELDEFPEERAIILLETAQHWHHTGQTDAAIELLAGVVDLGGEDGGSARVALAEILFDCDRIDDAWAQLDALRGERVASPLPYHHGAELLEARGDFDQALTWFNIAVSHLTPAELAEREGPLGVFSCGSGLFAGRRRVRQSLGMPEDEFDQSVQSLAQRADEVVQAAAPPQSASAARILFWPRPEISDVKEIWPDLVDTTDIDGHFAERENSKPGTRRCRRGARHHGAPDCREAL